MVTTIYIFILSYFVLGALGFYFINRRKEKEVARKSWTKFIAYFFIINILFFSIVVHPLAFQVLTGLIIAVGLFELFRLLKNEQYKQNGFFALSIVIYGILSFGFWKFSVMEKEIILFTFLILSIFDAFSQISGQLWGKRKIAPEISPNKTVGGTVGGAVFALLSAYFLRSLTSGNVTESFALAVGIIVFAFVGDIAASFYKRKFGVKDYSNLIPGHGGFLDRFDSLIAGAAWVSLFFCIW